MSSQRKFDIKRGRHRKAASVETREWNKKHVHRPACPPWMSEETYARLLTLRREVDPWTDTSKET